MHRALLEVLADRTTPETRVALTRMIREIARAFAPWLGPASRASLAAVLGEATLHAAEREPADIRMLYDSIGPEARVPAAAAVELTQTVLVAIGRVLGPDARKRLASDLPPPWCELLEDPHDVAHDRRCAPALDPRDGHTLASGRPGSDAPLSTAAPPPGEADSIAASDDPRADRRLSSGHGPVPTGRAIAEGRKP